MDGGNLDIITHPQKLRNKKNQNKFEEQKDLRKNQIKSVRMSFLEI